MESWQGAMNWPLHADWKCPFCGQRALVWGVVHGVCRCADCHVQFKMRNEQSFGVDRPICRLRPEYVEPFRRAWKELRIPVDQLTDEQWDTYFEEG